MPSDENVSKTPISRRKFLKTGTAAAVVAVVAGVGGFLALREQPGPAPAAPAPAPAPVAAPTPAATPAMEVVGADAEERALEGVRLLKAAGKMPSDVKLNVLQIAGTLHQWQPRTEDFTQLTGIPVEHEEIDPGLTFEKILEEATTRRGRWDLITYLSDFLSDSFEAGTALPLDDFARTYRPEYLDPSNCPVMSVNQKGSIIDGKLPGMVVCGDQQNLYLRTDLTGDPKNQQGFETQFGYPLPVNGPDTWEKLRDMVEFFDTNYKAEGIRGGLFFRNISLAPGEFAARFFGAGGMFFDDNMNPAFSSAAGRKAVEDMHAFVPFMSDVMIRAPLYEEQFVEYPAGKAFAAYSWPALGTFTLAGSVAQNAAVYEVPGYMVNGKLVRTTVIVANFGAIVNRYGANPELAYLLLQYLNSPRVSSEILTLVGFFNDPWRECHFADPRIAEKWPQAEISMPAMRRNNIIALPHFRLVQWAKLSNILGTNLNEVFTGIKDVDTALRDVDEGWAQVTDREVGIEKQRGRWETWKRDAPPAIKELHGWT